MELAAGDLMASFTYGCPTDLDCLCLLDGATDIEAEPNGRYRFDIDLDRAIAEAPADRREPVAVTVTFDGDAEPQITGKVALDEEGRMRELSILRIVRIQRPAAEEQETCSSSILATTCESSSASPPMDIDEKADVEGRRPRGRRHHDAPEAAALLELEGAR